ncbi:MAG: hypothetical protein HeimC3_14300 [Candidatus Heimdallarchaeota archaeon LC_3]|nr:MAG: hypothetical protein HeimC3_14300 [Candidatus Heimdallarchaeota archaeon LC_3]
MFKVSFEWNYNNYFLLYLNKFCDLDSNMEKHEHSKLVGYSYNKMMRKMNKKINDSLKLLIDD